MVSQQQPYKWARELSACPRLQTVGSCEGLLPENVGPVQLRPSTQLGPTCTRYCGTSQRFAVPAVCDSMAMEPGAWSKFAKPTLQTLTVSLTSFTPACRAPTLRNSLQHRQDLNRVSARSSKCKQADLFTALARHSALGHISEKIVQDDCCRFDLGSILCLCCGVLPECCLADHGY